METKLLFIQALSPLHAGTGQGVDVIDLPIAKEKATGIPFLPGSSIKGVLRDTADLVFKDEVNAVFGSPELENAGAAVFTDARLVLLPIRSLAGTFAYVTSPYLLKRLARDIATLGGAAPKEITLPEVGHCATATETALELQQTVVLEELDLTTNRDGEEWATWLSRAFDDNWKEFFKKRFCIVHDDAMSFLLETATEVTARIALEEETKTVARGALWYEESLPTESLLVSLVQTSNEHRRKDKPQEDKLDANGVMQKIELLAAKPVQFGGKSSVGRGVCRLQLTGVV